MKLKQKLMAAILTVMMLTSYIATLTDAVIAAGSSLLNQNSQTNHANVEFNSYFEGEEHSKTFEMGKEAKLYLKLKINRTGYLKNGVVQFLNANFEVDSNSLKHDKIQSGSKDKIDLKQINNGEEVVIEVPLTMLAAEKVDKDFLSKIATVRFTGTYMDENGKEKAIEKEISNQLSWIGTAEVELAGEVNKYLPYQTAEEKGVMVQVKVRSNLKNNRLPVEKTKLEVSLPEITIAEGNTVKPERITVVANSTKATNGKGSLEFREENYRYNEETNKVEIQVENKEEEGKIAWNKKVADEYIVTFIYTGEEVYNKVQEQLEKAQTTIKTEEEKKQGEKNENAITGEIAVEAKITPCDNEKKELTQSGKISYSIEKAKGELIDTTISTASKLSKGYIYANYAKMEKKAKKQEIEEEKDTPYTVNYTVQIQDKLLTSSVELQTVKEKYLDKNVNEYNIKKDDVYTKTVRISEAVFTKMLGEEGKIEIQNTAGEKLAEITANSEKDSQGNYVVNIAEATVNEIIIRTTQPVTEGAIGITVEKAISAKQQYSKEEMQEFKQMILEVMTKTYNTIREEQNGEEATKELMVSNTTKKANINLTEPVSKAEISVNTQNLSTIVENKDVEIRVVLDTSSNENALYRNPTLQIVLPENIEKLKIKSSDILLDDELKIKETKVVEQNGRKVILIDLTGTQTKYMDNGMTQQSNVISKGANIVLKADITFNKLIPSANSNIYLYYTNDNTDLFEECYQKPKARSMSLDESTIGMAKTGISIVAPNGVIAESHMSGYKDNANISNATDTKQTENIDANGAKREVTIGGAIVNNYSNNIENVAILGRIPFSGNKAVDDEEELGSNFTMAMKEKIVTSGIDASRVKVYYSTNGEANKNLIDANNNWTEEPENLAEIKSYLIIMNGEIAQGTQFSFDYKTELPANLAHNKQAYTNYKVYYDNKMEDATIGETKIAGTIGLTTGQGPELQVSVTSSNNTTREGQIIKMTATIQNIGGVAAENAKLLITAPENTIHVERSQASNYYYEDSDNSEKEILLGDIKPGETVTKSYELKVNKLETENSERTIENLVRISANNMTGEIKSETYSMRILDGELSIISSNDYVDKIIKSANTVTCTIAVQNISNEKDLDNVIVTIPIPTNMKVKDAYYSYNTSDLQTKIKDNISIASNSITINLGTLKSHNKHKDEVLTTDYAADIRVRLTSEGFTGSFDYVVTGKADGIEEQQSNPNTLIGKETKLSIEAQPLDSKYIPENTEFTYKFTVKNIGEVTSINNKVEIIIPEGTRLEQATYTYKGETKTRTTAVKGIVTLEIYSIEPDDQVEISVTARAQRLTDKNNKEIMMWANLEAQGVSKIQSNQISAMIEYDENLHPGGSSWTQTPDDNKGETTSRYKITGTAWIDADKNGQRDEQEEVLAGIQVILLHKANSQVVKDETTGEEKITTTNKDGQYEFTRLKPGEYLVLFLYDAGKYSITDYQKDGVAQSLNSDATSMKIIFNGEQRQAGVSNTIKITNSHVRDIDIGLFIAEKFDLRLDKYISKVITTTPSNGTKTYHYKNSKITKREIAKKDAQSTNLVVEYKIVVTNEGQIEGYAKKIIDYLPEGAKFSSELNKDWYLSNHNGAVYNNALENEKIAPGQSKEVKLVLSFTINNKNIGKMMNNNAEIYESYNELGLEDIDSIAANQVETEDDMSSADIIVSIATGSIILYTTLTFAIAILLGMGIYEIKKRVLNKENM